MGLRVNKRQQDPRLEALSNIRRSVPPELKTAGMTQAPEGVGELPEITKYRDIVSRFDKGDTKGTAGYDIEALREAVRQYDERVNPEPGLLDRAIEVFK